jgi:chemotaxis signal transduction protein
MLVLTFQVGSESVGLDIRRVHAVVPRVDVKPLSGSPSWLAGTFVYRSEIVPVIDLFRLSGAGSCPANLSSRIILVRPNSETGLPALLGLLAANVADIREFEPKHSSPNVCRANDAVNLGPAFFDGANVMRMLDPDHMLPERMRYEVVA